MKNLNYGDARLASASSRCASGSGTRAPTPASRQARAAGQVVPRPGRGGQEAADRRRQVDRPTRTSSATGSPTSSAPPSSTAAATRLKLDEANEPARQRRRAGRAGGRRRSGRRRRSTRRRRRERRRGRRRRAPGRGRSRRVAGRDRRGQRARPEGAGGDRGGVEVHRHAVPVGRLDAADRLRLLGPDAVGLRAVRDPDPARDLRRRSTPRTRIAVDRRRRPASPATWSSSPTPATSTTSACTSATTSSCTRRTPATW